MVQLKGPFYILVQTQSQAGPIWLPGENILIFLFLLPMAANCLISVADIFLGNNSPSDYTRRDTDAPFLLSLDYLSIFYREQLCKKKQNYFSLEQMADVCCSLQYR